MTETHSYLCDNHNGQEDRQCAPASPPSAIVPPVRCSYAHEVAQVWDPLKISFQVVLDALDSEFLVLLLGFYPCSHLLAGGTPALPNLTLLLALAVPVLRTLLLGQK